MQAVFRTISFDGIAFIAVQSGTPFTEPPGTGIPDDIGLGLGAAVGFTPPVVSRTWTYWIQQTSTVPVDFGMDFIVTPQPTTTMPLGTGLLALSISRGRIGLG